MKNFLCVAALTFCFSALFGQNSVNLSGLQFQRFDKTAGSSEALKFISNTQATYIISGVLPLSGKTYRDECPCKCTVSGTKVTINCVCSDRDVYPDPITDAFTYDSKTQILTSTKYKYTNDSAPTADLAWKFHVWKKK